jgi:peptidoglycan/xylan/chitin deacetylase (PgdA/CDA1 family)
LKPQPKTVLAYHEIMPDSNYAYCVPRAAFDQQLRLVDSLARQSGTRAGAQVTFDDGEQSQYHIAAPLLAEYGVAATYFVTPGLIGTASKFLGWKLLRELMEAGHSIQSHGWSHKFLTSCSDVELDHELRAAKETLEDQLGAAVEEISIPGGRWDRRVMEGCARAGYKRAYVSEPWIDDEIAGVRVVGRFMVRRTTSLAELAKMVERDRRAFWVLKMRSQLKRQITKVIGEGRYHRLWCRLTGYNDFEEARRQST